MALTFFGGIKIENKKYSRSKQLRHIPPPNVVYIPIKEPVKYLVTTKDSVRLGQAVAFCDNELCFSSVSGTVKGIAREGRKRYIAIENDKKNTPYEGLKGVDKPLTVLRFEEICSLLRQYAIIDSFDKIFLYEKLLSIKRKAKRIIINCCEHDPYATSIFRLIKEKPKELIAGAKILMHALSVGKCIFVIEQDKKNAIADIIEFINDDDMFITAFIESKYPINEKTIMSAVYGKEIPYGKSAIDIGYVFFGAEAVIQIFDSFLTGIPQTTKAVTVSGECIANPSNLIVPLGTPIKELIDECGGVIGKCKYVVCGGLMNGEYMSNAGGVVTHLSDQFLFLNRSGKHRGDCIKCGRCIEVCPMYLPPMDYANSAENNKHIDINSYYGISACIECGCCEYICPTGVPLLDIIRSAKQKTPKDQQKGTKTTSKMFTVNRRKWHRDNDDDIFIPF